MKSKVILPNIPIPLGVKTYAPPPPAGSVLYLTGYPPMGSTIYDRSGSANNGTIAGATWVRRPSGMWGLSADGNDLVNCGSNASLSITGNYTLIYWIVPDASLTGGIVTAKITSAVGNANTRTFASAIETAKIVMRQGYGTGATACASLTSLTASVPNFVAFTVNETTDLISVFLASSTADATAAFTGTASTNTGTLWLLGIAAQGDFSASYSKSALYLLRIIPGAMTGTQLMNIRNQERSLFGV